MSDRNNNGSSSFSRTGFIWVGLAALATLFLAACNFPGWSPAPPARDVRDTLPPQTRSEGELVSASPQSPTPTVPPRILTICLASEPESLFLYGSPSLTQSRVFEAIYDGPIDVVNYTYQPVILEKLPSLADGDASLRPVTVLRGDWVVNDAGELVPLDSGQMVRPAGCASAECAIAWDGGAIEMDQLSATFTIKAGITWSDGTPLTAADSVFSFELARQCQSESGPCGGLGLITRSHLTLQRTTNYTARDERTIEWVGVPGFRDPNYAANFFIPLPRHQLGGLSFEELLSAEVSSRQPLGWGPYVVERWVPGDHILLRANPTYFRADEGLPRFDLLIFRFFNAATQQQLAGDPERLRNALSTGLCDLFDEEVSTAFLQDGVEPLKKQADNRELSAFFAAGPEWEQLVFGIRPASYDDGYQPGLDRPDLLADPLTRQGLALCMDRGRLREALFTGFSSTPVSYLPPEHPLNKPDLPRYEHDPQAGAALLEQVGWIDQDGDPRTPRTAAGIPGVPDDTPLQLTYFASDTVQHREAAEILSASMGKCGVRVALQLGPAGEVYAPGPEGAVFGRHFDLAQFVWSSGPQPRCELWTSTQIPGDPSQIDAEGAPLFPFGWGGTNAGGFSSAEFDQACQAASEALPGQAGYLQAHYKAQEVFASQLPVLPLYQHLRVVVARSDLCGLTFDPSARSELAAIEFFDYGQGCGD